LDSVENIGLDVIVQLVFSGTNAHSPLEHADHLVCEFVAVFPQEIDPVFLEILRHGVYHNHCVSVPEVAEVLLRVGNVRLNPFDARTRVLECVHGVVYYVEDSRFDREDP